MNSYLKDLKDNGIKIVNPWFEATPTEEPMDMFVDFKSLYPTIQLHKWQSDMLDTIMNPNTIRLRLFSRGYGKTTLSRLFCESALLFMIVNEYPMFRGNTIDGLRKYAMEHDPIKLSKINPRLVFLLKCWFMEGSLRSKIAGTTIIFTEYNSHNIKLSILNELFANGIIMGKLVNECWSDSGECIEAALMMFKEEILKEVDEQFESAKKALEESEMVYMDTDSFMLIPKFESHKLDTFATKYIETPKKRGFFKRLLQKFKRGKK